MKQGPGMKWIVDDCGDQHKFHSNYRRSKNGKRYSHNKLKLNKQKSVHDTATYFECGIQECILY